jgi:hypothetical protein
MAPPGPATPNGRMRIEIPPPRFITAEIYARTLPRRKYCVPFRKTLQPSHIGYLKVFGALSAHGNNYPKACKIFRNHRSVIPTRSMDTETKSTNTVAAQNRYAVAPDPSGNFQGIFLPSSLTPHAISTLQHFIALPVFPVFMVFYFTIALTLSFLHNALSMVWANCLRAINVKR